jgi:hypothetical protein
MVGGVLTPGPLDWSFHLPNLDGIYFENTLGKTLLLVRNRSLTETFRLTLFPIGLPVPEYPDHLDKDGIGWIDILPGNIVIIGSFSSNFNDEDNFIHYITQGITVLNDVDLAVVKFPE